MAVNLSFPYRSRPVGDYLTANAVAGLTTDNSRIRPTGYNRTDGSDPDAARDGDRMGRGGTEAIEAE